MAWGGESHWNTLGARYTTHVDAVRRRDALRLTHEHMRRRRLDALYLTCERSAKEGAHTRCTITTHISGNQK